MTPHREAGLSDGDALAIYRHMLLARILDERLALLRRGGAIHLALSCRGHEAAQAGTGYALRGQSVWWLPYYRDLGVVLAAGSTPADILLCAFERAADPSSGGRQTPFNWGDRRHRIVARSAPVGVQVPQAAGLGLALRLRGDAAAVYCSFGEGAASQGDVHEGLNFAGLHRLPCLFVCQNNGYAISVPVHRQVAGGSVAARAAGYGVAGAVVDGLDPFACYAAARAALGRALAGGGPTLLELRCARLDSHTADDDHRGYRTAAELAQLADRDPLPRLRRYLEGEDLLDEAAAVAMAAAVQSEVDSAEAAARAAPIPRPEDALIPVYAADNRRYQTGTAVSLAEG